MTIAGEQARRGIAVTIAYGDEPTATRAVFTGSVEDVRRDLAAYFGIEHVNDGSLTASDVVVNATSLAHATATIAGQLGGKVIPATPTTEPAAEPHNHSQAAPAGDPWLAAAGTHQGDAAGPDDAGSGEQHPLLAVIERASDIPALQRIWVSNQDAFSVPEIAAAWKAKGRALQQAA